ncbi:MAG: gamma carbonic anhydrase family protein [Candidatus Krumholzibacteriota bacterium]|nr:gamma carbonic anhydrase family protein [Candidatus Krumholzibacteriota bacterium]
MPVYTLGTHQPELGAGCWIGPGAQVVGRVVLGENVNVWFGTVIRGDVNIIRIGADTNVQDNATLHVDADYPLTIGARVTIGHGAVVHGCTLEDEVLVGMGAVILNGARVGRGSLVAAGALVREGDEIPPFSLVAGVPAAVKKTLDAAATGERHRHSAAHYVASARVYAAQLAEPRDG